MFKPSSYFLVYSRSNSSDSLRYTVKKSARELFVLNGSRESFKVGLRRQSPWQSLAWDFVSGRTTTGSPLYSVLRNGPLHLCCCRNVHPLALKESYPACLTRDNSCRTDDHEYQIRRVDWVRLLVHIASYLPHSPPLTSPVKGFLMFSPSSSTLQQLHRLDRPSSTFHDQLCNVLYGEEYKKCVPNLQGNDLVWFVDYLDDVG